ncbi:MAG: 3',5'-cyclic-nucleotide phosphodiesterase [Planctomycetota bacterium]|nr:3',5'-cyclic-nucleotide phosphodiesterase [Planctomycetota bacterium]
MQLRVLGCAGGSAPEQRLSGYLLDGVLAIDAGSLTTALTVDEQRAVEAVALTHGHLDHVWSLPLFLANRFGGAKVTCNLYASAFTMETIRTHLFNDRIWPDFTQAKVANVPLVEFHDVEPGDEVRVLDRYDVKAIPLDHTVPCQGYRIRTEAGSIIVCGDTSTTELLWQVADRTDDLKGILIECSFTDDLHELAHASGHMTPDLLGQDLKKLHKDVPIHVMHLKPGYGPGITAALNALGDDRIHILQQDAVIDVE